MSLRFVMENCTLFCKVIYQTLETVFYHVSKHQEESRIDGGQRSNSDEVRESCKCGEALS